MKQLISQYGIVLAMLSAIYVTQAAEDVISLKRMAEQGDADAMCELGRCYRNGLGVKKDAELAVLWTERAASNGCDRAVGLCYQFGYCGVKPNVWNAVKWFRKAAEKGDLKAMRNLGDCYYKGYGVLRDKGEAVRWYRKAAELSDEIAQFRLGTCYAIGSGVTRNYAEAMKWYRKAADQGLAKASLSLWLSYKFGEGVVANESVAKQWLNRAANQNYSGGCAGHLSALRGLAVDEKTSEEKLEKARENVARYRKAREDVARCREESTRRNLNVPGRLAEIRQKAEAGDPAARCELVWSYETGNYRRFGSDTSVDDAQAHKWLLEAASNGCVCAEGLCRQFGIGVEKDQVRAASCYRKAAEIGDVGAQSYLGFCLLRGNGAVKERKKFLIDSAIMADHPEEYLEPVMFVAVKGTIYANVVNAIMEVVPCFDWNPLPEENAWEGAVSSFCADKRFSAVTGFVSMRPKECEGKEAVKWFRKAAEKGNAKAQFGLGLCYYNGIGLTKSIEEAILWFRKAAEQGEPFAQVRLGDLYSHGVGLEWWTKGMDVAGVAKDLDIAAAWYLNAAEQGDVEAMNRLGLVVGKLYCSQYWSKVIMLILVVLTFPAVVLLVRYRKRIKSATGNRQN